MSDTPRTDESRGYYGYDDACPAYDMQKLERELAASQAGQAELLARLEERTQSHLAASARDVQTIQRQAVELAKWQALAEMLAKTGGWSAEPDSSWDAALAAYEEAKSGNLPDPLAEAVKRCDWKEDEDGNWYTACHQFMCFEHAPPNEQGYIFCHRCGHPINFIEFAPPLDEPPGPA